MAIPAFNQLQPDEAHGEIDFLGEQFFCDHHGAMFWSSKNCMIVSDLHLEKGAAMAARGVMA
ncbi:FIG006285: ICC-like protein phosphoesterase, partial [hydrothermal vent metagenome]